MSSKKEKVKKKKSDSVSASEGKTFGDFQGNNRFLKILRSLTVIFKFFFV